MEEKVIMVEEMVTLLRAKSVGIEEYERDRSRGCKKSEEGRRVCV